MPIYTEYEAKSYFGVRFFQYRRYLYILYTLTN